MDLASRKLIVTVLAVVLLVLDGTGVLNLGSVRGELTTVVVGYVVGQGAVDAVEKYATAKHPGPGGVNG